MVPHRHELAAKCIGKVDDPHDGSAPGLLLSLLFGFARLPRLYLADSDFARTGSPSILLPLASCSISLAAVRRELHTTHRSSDTATIVRHLCDFALNIAVIHRHARGKTVHRRDCVFAPDLRIGLEYLLRTRTDQLRY